MGVFYVSMDLKATTANIYESNSDFYDDKFISVEKVLKGSTKAKLKRKLIKPLFHQRWMADNNRADAASSGSESEVNDVLIQLFLYTILLF